MKYYFLSYKYNMVNWRKGIQGPQRRRRPTRRAAARRIQRMYRRRRRRPRNSKLTRVVKRVIAKQNETLHLDHKFTGGAGATYNILPWGVDSDLARGNVLGDILPVNQLDNIHQTGSVLVAVGDSMRQGDSIYMKSMRVQLRLLAPVFRPTITPANASIGKQGPDMHAKIRLLVVFDTQGEQSLPLATTTTGVLAEIYQDLQFCTSAHRSLATFKGYRTNKRFKVLSQRILHLDGSTSSKSPYRDVDFSVKINKKVTYIPSTDTCQQGIYVFAMSDYPSSTTSGTQFAPKVLSFWARYYYSDP